MDPEVKRALANIRRRRAEIERTFGKTEDEGPLFDRSRRSRSERATLDAELEELEDFDDDGNYLQGS